MIFKDQVASMDALLWLRMPVYWFDFIGIQKSFGFFKNKHTQI